MRDIPEGAIAVVCSKAGDPSKGGWYAQAVGDVDKQCPPERNNYLNCSSFRPNDDGSVNATKATFAACHFIMLDDVGSKVAESNLAGVEPTCIIETSKGNCQWLLRLDPPVTNADEVVAIQNAIAAAGLSDPGSKGVGRWVRLPNAINGKDKHKDETGRSFQCRLVAWNLDTAYTVEGVAAALSLQLAAPAVSRVASGRAPSKRLSGGFAGNAVFTPAPSEYPVLTALKARGLYKKMIRDGLHEITCPWRQDHTDALDTGAACFDPTAEHPYGGFNCKHSHGDQLSIRNLLEHLDIKSDDATGKPRIRTMPGHINGIVEAAEFLLAETGEYFQCGGVIVRIHRDGQSRELSTSPVNEQQLTAELADAAIWEKSEGKGQWVRCDPGPKYVQTLLRCQKYQHLPVLNGLARQPYFRESDGVLVVDSGYDSVSGILADFDASDYQIGAPTHEDAVAALEALNVLIGEFHFATEADRSATLSAIFTATVRPGLPYAPAFSITASMPGSGKSFLARTIALFASPAQPTTSGYPATAEEASKAILAALMTGPPAIVFDDMQTDWKPHAVLNRMLTSDKITDRILGASRTATVSTRVLLLGTGNNIEAVGDMTRRVITARLQPKTSTPFELTYDRDPVKLLRANRDKFVSYVLIIIRAWLAAGRPMTDVPPIASFEGPWSEYCRQPLLWLGLPDPAASLMAQVKADPYIEPLRHLLKAWHGRFGDGSVTVRNVIEDSDQSPLLAEALDDLPVTAGGMIDRNRFGHFLKKNVGRIVDGLELQHGDLTERKSWRVVQVAIEGGKGG
ncbi:DNA-primase RepB domain-containing protein [Blastomonas fulva]|uniref:DNA-primase RepB domain-containing protein n=1 Tax=Blastomonas fulva TaxID=1550728 RepID=UPI003D26F372